MSPEKTICSTSVTKDWLESNGLRLSRSSYDPTRKTPGMVERLPPEPPVLVWIFEHPRRAKVKQNMAATAKLVLERPVPKLNLRSRRLLARRAPMRLVESTDLTQARESRSASRGPKLLLRVFSFSTRLIRGHQPRQPEALRLDAQGDIGEVVADGGLAFDPAPQVRVEQMSAIAAVLIDKPLQG